MTRLVSPGALSASLHGAPLSRRGALATAACAALTACGRTPPLTASRTPPLDMKALNRDVADLARRAIPGRLGVGLMNLDSGEHFTCNGDQRFPMQSVFKLPLACAVLAEVDARRVAITEVLTLTDEQLSPPWSPIAEAWPGRAAYNVGELISAAVGDSDNTAADVLMKRIGGPGAVTAWLADRQIMEIRVDRYERELGPDVFGMASFRPAWRGAAFGQAMATVPPQTRHAATLAYLADPRDTATPRGMLTLLAKLDGGELISPASTRRLLDILWATPRGAERLKAGLPRDARFAHKIGTSGTDQGLTAAYNDVGVFTLKDRRSYAVAAFLAGSTAAEPERAALFADLGRTLARHVG